MMRILCLLVLSLVLVAGCTTDEADESRLYEAQLVAGEEPAGGNFHADVDLYRRYTGDKWMLDKDHKFAVKDESHVRGKVMLRNLRPKRTYSVHLVWIRPDGAEMFRRYAEVTRHEVGLPPGVTADSTGALPAAMAQAITERWGDKVGAKVLERLAAAPEETVPVTERLWKNAEDLGDIRAKAYLNDEPVVQLISNLNISREKERELGDYIFRIYLDRRLLKEVPFTLEDRSAG